MAIDSITTEIIRNRTESIARQMSIVMQRAAYSPTMYSGGDYSAGIFDASGFLVSLATKVPMHILPIVGEVSEGIRKYGADLKEGDIFVTNSPYHGGTHLPDVCVIMPVFSESLLAFAALRAHWSDVGGMTPGSISGQAREIFQEGLRLPFVRLGRNEEVDPAVLDIIRANVRLPDEASGDLRAQIAACDVCRQHLAEMVAKYGVETVRDAWDDIRDTTNRRVRRLLASLPRTTTEHFDYLDNDGVSPTPVRLQVAVRIDGEQVTVDYTGSSPEGRGCINATEATAAGMAYVGLKSFLDPEGSINHGLIEPIAVHAPAGTVVNARPPSATGGFSEVAYNLANLMMAVLADIDSARVCASGGGTANHQYISGFRHDDGNRFIYYEYQPGGCGATNKCDGAGSSRDLASGFVGLQSIEVIESRFPVKVRRHEILQDSGGAGRWRGGPGHMRDVQVFGHDLEISVIAEHVRIPPFGLAGGRSGSCGSWSLVSEEGEVELSELGGKVGGRSLADGAVVRLRTPGGGGFGDPLERDCALLSTDIVRGYISRDAAENVYGVVFRDGAIDHQRTAERRQAILASRTRLRMAGVHCDKRVGNFAVVHVSPTVAERFDGLTELLSETHCAPVRVRALADECLSAAEIKLAPDVKKVLRSEDGDFIWVRAALTSTGT